MESRAKLLGHPVHPMLIVFPLGLLATAIAFDIVGLVSGVLLFVVSWFMRKPIPTQPSTGAFTLSFIAVALALVTSWLGGELVDRLGVGVDRGAHLDAPSSLSGRPATESMTTREIRRAA